MSGHMNGYTHSCINGYRRVQTCTDVLDRLVACTLRLVCVDVCADVCADVCDDMRAHIGAMRVNMHPGIRVGI